MNINVDVVFRSATDEKLLSKIAEILTAIQLLGKTMANELDELTSRVTASGDATDSAVLLLNGLKARLDAAGTDPVALKALSDALGTNTDELAAAIIMNTPSQK